MKKATSGSWAVKYRPQKLFDVIGQEAAVTEITGSINKRSLPSAYLLHGMRGCGKTTIARLIAKTINCKTFDACGTCDNCKLNLNVEGGHPDFLEVDVGDRRGIDDARGLARLSKLGPQLGNLRIIFLDEAHRIGMDAAPAYLKPLEEPPYYMLWILATTDPDKLIGTIKSRCQSVALNPVSKEATLQRLKHIAQQEQLSWVDDKILETIAQASGGYVRDSIQALEKVANYVQGGGVTDRDLINKIAFNSILSADPEVDINNAATKILAGIYLNAPKLICNGAAEVTDFIPLANKLIAFNQYLIDVITTTSSPNIYFSAANKLFRNRLEKALIKRNYSPNIIRGEQSLGILLNVSATLVTLRQDLQFFSMPRSMITAKLGLLAHKGY